MLNKLQKSELGHFQHIHHYNIYSGTVLLSNSCLPCSICMHKKIYIPGNLTNTYNPTQQSGYSKERLDEYFDSYCFHSVYNKDLKERTNLIQVIVLLK